MFACVDMCAFECFGVLLRIVRPALPRVWSVCVCVCVSMCLFVDVRLWTRVCIFVRAHTAAYSLSASVRDG